jgi:hypothetical protein
LGADDDLVSRARLVPGDWCGFQRVHRRDVGVRTMRERIGSARVCLRRDRRGIASGAGDRSQPVPRDRRRAHPDWRARPPERSLVAAGWIVGLSVTALAVAPLGGADDPDSTSPAVADWGRVLVGATLIVLGVRK